jgi:hypothetical protein
MAGGECRDVAFNVGRIGIRSQASVNSRLESVIARTPATPRVIVPPFSSVGLYKMEVDGGCGRGLFHDARHDKIATSIDVVDLNRLSHRVFIAENSSSGLLCEDDPVLVSKSCRSITPKELERKYFEEFTAYHQPPGSDFTILVADLAWAAACPESNGVLDFGD